MCDLNDQLSPEEIRTAAGLYDETEYSALEAKIEGASKGIRKRGYLLRSEFLDIVRWKNLRFRTDRNERLWTLNEDAAIRSISASAFAARSEIEAIVLLTGLRGVSVRTATAILHFGRKHRSPILDVNALTELNAPVEIRRVTADGLRDLRTYRCYAGTLKRMRRRLNLPMGTLDKALFIIGRSKNRIRGHSP